MQQTVPLAGPHTLWQNSYGQQWIPSFNSDINTYYSHIYWVIFMQNYKTFEILQALTLYIFILA